MLRKECLAGASGAGLSRHGLICFGLVPSKEKALKSSLHSLFMIPMRDDMYFSSGFSLLIFILFNPPYGPDCYNGYDVLPTMCLTVLLPQPTVFASAVNDFVPFFQEEALSSFISFPFLIQCCYHLSNMASNRKSQGRGLCPSTGVLGAHRNPLAPLKMCLGNSA